MNAALAFAGTLALAGAAVHGIMGDRIVRNIAPGILPGNPFGGPDTTWTFIWVSWHLVTLTFLVSGIALVWVSASHDPALVRGVGAQLLALYASFAVLALGTTASPRRWRMLLRHPAPIGFVVTAVLIWWGALK